MKNVYKSNCGVKGVRMDKAFSKNIYHSKKTGVFTV